VTCILALKKIRIWTLCGHELPKPKKWLDQIDKHLASQRTQHPINYHVDLSVFLQLLYRKVVCMVVLQQNGHLKRRCLHADINKQCCCKLTSSGNITQMANTASDVQHIKIAYINFKHYFKYAEHQRINSQ